MTWHRSPSLFHSFNHAAEGIVQAVRTQRNLWIHFAIAVAVLVAAVGFGATKLELAVEVLSPASARAVSRRTAPRLTLIPNRHIAASVNSRPAGP